MDIGTLLRLLVGTPITVVLIILGFASIFFAIIGVSGSNKISNFSRLLLGIFGLALFVIAYLLIPYVNNFPNVTNGEPNKPTDTPSVSPKPTDGISATSIPPILTSETSITNTPFAEPTYTILDTTIPIITFGPLNPVCRPHNTLYCGILVPLKWRNLPNTNEYFLHAVGHAYGNQWWIAGTGILATSVDGEAIITDAAFGKPGDTIEIYICATKTVYDFRQQGAYEFDDEPPCDFRSDMIEINPQ